MGTKIKCTHTQTRGICGIKNLSFSLQTYNQPPGHIKSHYIAFGLVPRNGRCDDKGYFPVSEKKLNTVIWFNLTFGFWRVECKESVSQWVGQVGFRRIIWNKSMHTMPLLFLIFLERGGGWVGEMVNSTDKQKTISIRTTETTNKKIWLKNWIFYYMIPITRLS